jgi:3-dehydroquinate synthase class II
MEKITTIGFSGETAGYEVIVTGNHVHVLRDGNIIASQQDTISNLGAFVGKAKELRLGWGRFEDGMEVIYIYDKGDDFFGYALNLHFPDFSEWGYAPFQAER